jgi:xanthine dehydrogenase YagS FAD-binding subunit
MLNRFAYVRPKSLDEAIKHLSSDGARVHAGGTDLLGCLRDHVFDAKELVSLSGMKSLRGIRKSSDRGMRIGALTTITEVAGHSEIRRRYAALAQGASEVASPQLRNQGTIGGNICQKPRCWYYRGEFHCLRKGGEECFAVGGENAFHCIFGGESCYIVHPSDTAPALAAFGARVHIRGPKGKRSVLLDNFYVLPEQDYRKETVLEQDEIVTEIELPPPVEGLRSSYRKVRARRSWDFALAGVALAVVFKKDQVLNASVFLSGVASIPWRSKEVEEVIKGKRLDVQIIRQAAEAAVQKALPMEQNAYKIPILRSVIEEQLQAIAQQS